MTTQQQEIERGQKQSKEVREHSPSRRQGGTAVEARRVADPFSLMRRFSQDVDRLLGGFGMLRPWDPWSGDVAAESVWPKLEISQKGDTMVVQADLPGMNKDDVQVEVRDSELCISGERRSEHQSEGRGYIRSERSYGSFCRTIPLPDSAELDSATATFEDGVLNVEIKAPGAQLPGRRIEVTSNRPE